MPEALFELLTGILILQDLYYTNWFNASPQDEDFADTMAEAATFLIACDRHLILPVYD